jgi:hypothetical protein
VCLAARALRPRDGAISKTARKESEHAACNTSASMNHMADYFRAVAVDYDGTITNGPRPDGVMLAATGS